MASAPQHDHHFARPQPDEAVFLVGLGRSGTTMARLMLHAHPEFAVLSETWWGPRVWDARWGFPMRDPVEPFRSRLAERFVGLLHKHDDFPMDLDAYRDELLAGPPDLAWWLAKLGRRWAARVGSPRWGEKTPVHVDHLAVLARLFPQARFVHLVRDPRDVAASLVDAPFAASSDPVSFAWAWLRTLDTEQACVAAHPPLAESLLRVRYEDLVTATQATLHRICAHVGVGFDERMLRFHALADDLAPDQSWMAGVHRPVSTSSLGRWRDDLGEGALHAIEGLCADRMRELGYEPSLPAPALEQARALAGRVRGGALDDLAAQTKPDDVAMQRGVYRGLLESL